MNKERRRAVDRETLRACARLAAQRDDYFPPFFDTIYAIMDKAAQIFLAYDKASEPYWTALVEILGQKESILPGPGNQTLVRLRVISYNLTDHQFILAKVKAKVEDQEGEVILHIPRRIVLMVIEGVGIGKDAFNFFAGRKK